MKQTLHYTDEKSDKFWQIETGGCALVVNWGRTGTAEQLKTQAPQTYHGLPGEQEILQTDQVILAAALGQIKIMGSLEPALKAGSDAVGRRTCTLKEKAIDETEKYTDRREGSGTIQKILPRPVRSRTAA
ncbi:MAG: WGR domain-containing protein [Lachnospiraceae bacterium]|nr:WGR domain-containing protein [Lachnospiraceae bacterium]